MESEFVPLWQNGHFFRFLRVCWLCLILKMTVNCDDEERITKGCELRCNLFRHKSKADTLQALSHPPAPWLDPRASLPTNLNGTNEPKIMNFLGQKWGAGNNGLFWVQFLGAGVATPPIYWAGSWSIPACLAGSLQNIETVILNSSTIILKKSGGPNTRKKYCR